MLLLHAVLHRRGSFVRAYLRQRFLLLFRIIVVAAICAVVVVVVVVVGCCFCHSLSPCLLCRRHGYRVVDASKRCCMLCVP